MNLPHIENQVNNFKIFVPKFIIPIFKYVCPIWTTFRLQNISLYYTHFGPFNLAIAQLVHLIT